MKKLSFLIVSLFLIEGCVSKPSKVETADLRDPASAAPPVIPVPNNQNGSSPQTPQISYQSNGGSGKDALQIPADQAGLAVSCQQKLAQDLAGRNIDTNDFVIAHQAYKVSYNFNYRVPNWVYYDLKKANLEYGCGKRKDKFAADPLLRSLQLPAVTEKDYKGSITGYDRGHMAPSADFLWRPEVNAESFFMTNMSPQTKNLNQRAWQELETKTRGWACGLGEAKIYTGPILNNQKFNRLESCVSIPNQFYKIIVGYRNGKYQGIGFIYNQTDDGDPYKQRAVSIREIEAKTGINFFNDQFAPEVQDSFEKEYSWADWDGLEQNCVKQACSKGGSSGAGASSEEGSGN